MMETALAWRTDDPPGVEFAAVRLEDDRLHASGVAIRSGPRLYRLTYELETAAGFVASRLALEVRGDGWSRRLELCRSPSGTWSSDAGELPDLAGALDCDLELSPLFNSTPVLRHGLLGGRGTHDFLMAWVSLPDLTVHPSGQRYTALPAGPDGAPRVRFETIDGTFSSDLTYDERGFVVEYPGMARPFSA